MQTRRTTAAFTLVELLVVISIILIAASVLFVGGSRGDGAALNGSLRIITGIANGARGQAILKNANVRLIIHKDDDDEKRLRFIGIIFATEDDPSTPEDESGWTAATQGTYLPKGIFFDPDESSESPSSWSTSNTMTLEYPRVVSKKEGSGEDFYYYEFESNGTMTPGFQNNWLVIRAGTLRPDASGDLEVKFEGGEESIIGGLIFRRAGTTTMVTDPSAF